MDKIYFTQQELKTALEAKGIKDNTSAKPVIDSMVKKGVVIEGYNDGSKGSINEPNILQNIATDITQPFESVGGSVKAGVEALGSYLGNKKEYNQAGMNLKDVYKAELEKNNQDNTLTNVIFGGATQAPARDIITGQGVEQLVGDVGKGILNVYTLGKGSAVNPVKSTIGTLAKQGAKYGAGYGATTAMQDGSNVENVLTSVLEGGVTGAVIGGGLGILGQGAVKGKNVSVNSTKQIINTTKKTLSDIKLPPPDGGGGAFSGIIQTGQELVDRVPRAASRVKENITEAGVRAEKIRTSSPAVKEAIKSNLDDRIINTVTQADEPTVKAFKDVLNIAEESSQTIGTKRQPSIVGGDLASQQFDIINSQKKSVGQKIGDLSKELSKTEKVNMQDEFKQMDNILSTQGIVPQYTKKGVKLNFTGSKYTPAERTKIQELYNLALEGGENLSPSIIREKDQLFSKLKRESNFEGIGDIIIETPEGSKSLFNVFRDIYSNKLDTVSPEMKVLNNEYRKLSQLTDDIENSIFKTPNFNVTKSVDPAEFAKVNLRRIFGESQSSPAFEAVADIMDKYSRGLGYKGASPKDVAEFAQEMRKLFPETIPKTGFSGGIKTGLGDLIETVSKAGTPNYADKQKALRNLLDSLSP